MIFNDGLPDPIYRAICNDPYSAGDSEYTPSSLATPVRIRALTTRHFSELREPASARFWAFLGQAIHSVLERTDIPGARKEERVYAQIAGKRIGAQFDLFTADGEVQDYKVTSVWSYVFNAGKAKPEWAAQLNVLAEILRREGSEVRRLVNVAILRDWQENKAKQEPDYPKLPSIQVDVPLWPSEDVERYVQERVTAHESAIGLTDEELPLCTPEERWDRPSTWAVMKDGRKRAVDGGVKSTEQAALDFIRVNNLGADHSVTERPGKSVRCESYCPVAQLCDYGRAMKMRGDE